MPYKWLQSQTKRYDSQNGNVIRDWVDGETQKLTWGDNLNIAATAKIFEANIESQSNVQHMEVKVASFELEPEYMALHD